MSDKKNFEYTYSAPTERERREIESIRRQYTTDSSDDKLARIKALDARIKSLSTAVSVSVGVVGCLIFGLGFAMVMEWGIIPWGILIGLLGCIAMGAAYPLNIYFLNRGKKRYGEEIIALADELLGE